MKTIHRFLADETGATAIEYGLIAAGRTIGSSNARDQGIQKLRTNPGVSLCFAG
jgi:hypothetical protein